MKRFVMVAAAACLSALAPFVPSATSAPPEQLPWPSRFEGRPLVRLAPGPGDEMLAREFPGHVARFSDGRRQIVLRQVARATRLLHPARDCFEGMGYSIEPLPIHTIGGDAASCFSARRGAVRFRVCEQVRDAAGHAYPDVSSWFWPALLGDSRAPWLAAMTVERSD